MKGKYMMIILAVKGDYIRIDPAYDADKALKRLQDGCPERYSVTRAVHCEEAVKGVKYLRSVLSGQVSAGWIKVDRYAKEVIISMFDSGALNWQLEKTALLGWIPLNKKEGTDYTTDFLREYNKVEAANKIKSNRKTVQRNLKVLKAVMGVKLHVLKTDRDGHQVYRWKYSDPLRDYHVWLLYQLAQVIKSNPGVSKTDLCERLLSRGLLTFDKYLDQVCEQEQARLA